MVGPGASARIICISRSLDFGSKAKIKTKIPIPPIQCVKLRQKSVACFKLSTSVKILDPVVVNPLTASKKQSTKEEISPDK